MQLKELRREGYGTLYQFGWNQQFSSKDRAVNAHKFAEWFLQTHSVFDIPRDKRVAWNYWWTEVAE